MFPELKTIYTIYNICIPNIQLILSCYICVWIIWICDLFFYLDKEYMCAKVEIEGTWINASKTTNDRRLRFHHSLY